MGTIQAILDRRDLLLARLYIMDALNVAELCDDHLDRSGALLGRVRECAAALRASPTRDTGDGHE